MTTQKPAPKIHKKAKSAKEAPAPVHSRPSMGDPDREQDSVPGDAELPDLDNETVHKTVRPDGPVIEDDDLDDEAAQEHQSDRDEDVSEGNPLHVGHYVGR